MASWMIFFGLFDCACSDLLEQCGFEQPKKSKRQVNVEETAEAYGGGKTTEKEKKNAGS